MVHTIRSYGLQETKNNQSSILKSSIKTQISNENLNNWLNNKDRLLVCPPPKLDKKNSYD